MCVEMPMGSYGGSTGIFAMIAMAVGYFVCVIANKEKGRLKKAGLVIGVIIIALSSILILKKALWIAKKYAKKCPVKAAATMPIRSTETMPYKK